jgi:hypothetical protein
MIAYILAKIQNNFFSMPGYAVYILNTTQIAYLGSECHFLWRRYVDSLPRAVT